jgi:tetratricopeptide (TPR) repeat protein
MESAGEQFFENTPFHAINEMLSLWLELQEASGIEEQFKRVERALASAGLKVAELAPLIADLMQLPAGERYPASTLAPEQKRRQLLAALVGWIIGAAKLQPLVMIVEDLHWLDPSTLELLELLADQSATVPLMLLYTTRPEFRAPWPIRTHHTQITLNRLSIRHVREIIAQVAARGALAGETIEAVIERTSGVPLFVEELTRSVLESGNAKLTEREIPVTLHDSLMARLDRLGPAKELLQIGAVIGGEFSYELLHAVYPISDGELRGGLRSLSDAELVYTRGVASDAVYQFKHALIRDAAYEALLKSRRKELHRLVAHSIEEKFPILKAAHPEVLARHWTEAGEIEAAIIEWTRAGESAQARNAFTEALQTYRQARELVEDLPESAERDQRDLELSQHVQRLCYMTKGFAAPETINAIKRCEMLAEKTGNLAAAVGFMNTRGFSAYFSGDLLTAGELANRALRLASGRGWSGILGNIHFLQVVTRHLRGDLAGVEEHFTAGLKFFDDPDFLRDRGSRVAVFSTAAGNAWMLGRAEVGRERNRLMMPAEHESNSYVVASSLLYAASFQKVVRDFEGAETLAVQALELSEKHQLRYIVGFSRCVLGHARAHLGHATEGVALIRAGIAGLLEGGLRLRVGYFTALLGDAEGLAGNMPDALANVERALELNPEILVYRPEILRMRGELRLKPGLREQAERDFRESIALARKMSAKAWELRTTMSLARLLQKEGRRREAHTMLAEIYNWFTEGFDTADLKDAKALLDELAT